MLEDLTCATKINWQSIFFVFITITKMATHPSIQTKYLHWIKLITATCFSINKMVFWQGESFIGCCCYWPVFHYRCVFFFNKCAHFTVFHTASRWNCKNNNTYCRKFVNNYLKASLWNKNSFNFLCEFISDSHMHRKIQLTCIFLNLKCYSRLPT